MPTITELVEEQRAEAEDSPENTLTFYPFAYALLSEEADAFCWYCLDQSKAHRRCSACKSREEPFTHWHMQTAMFCDRDCQTLGWEDHRLECKALTARKGRLPSVEVRMLGRIVARYKAIKTGKDKEIPHFYLNRSSSRSVMDLAHHAEDIRRDPPAYSKFKKLFQELKDFYGEKQLMDEETVFQLHCRNYINRHAISDRSYMREIAKGLYLDLCAYNHSCRPNVIYTCEGIVATLRPLHDGLNIRDKSTTFYTYIDILAHKAQRRKELKDTWYFHCECSRCLDDTEHSLTATVCPDCARPVHLFGSLSAKDVERAKLSCRSCGVVVPKEQVFQAFETMRFVDRTLNNNEIEPMGPVKARKFIEGFLSSVKGKLLPKCNIFYTRLLQQDAEEVMRTCFPARHPGLAYHLMNTGLFLGRLSRRKEALRYLREALAALTAVLGTDHPMTQHCSTALHHIQGEGKEEEKKPVQEPEN